MKLSVLHISDLHRDHDNPIRNDVLLTSLENDHRRYTSQEEPTIRAPDLIVVTGDAVGGVRMDDGDAEARLQQQYREAHDFLVGLADLFVGGDRGRVVIVPGNHDVSASHFAKSIERVSIPPDRRKELAAQLLSADSELRWSWQDFGLYRITDQDLYAQRLSAFADFYSAFYNGSRTYSLTPDMQVDLFDLPELDLAIAGFSSCFSNDPFRKQGRIHPGCIANVCARLKQQSMQGRLAIAVWHHSVEGLPERSDYMDAGILQNLIDGGFSIGLHGHQHRPQFLDTRFRYGLGRRMTVISAGTLCGDASYGHGRSYNIVELDASTRKGRLHVREMQNYDSALPIWGPRPLAPSGLSFSEFSYDPPAGTVPSASSGTRGLVEAQRLHESGEYRRAADMLDGLVAVEALARPVLLDCLLRLGDKPAIVAVFDPPQSSAEAIHLMDALWEEGMHERLGAVLNHHMVAASQDPSVMAVRGKYTARLTP